MTSGKDTLRERAIPLRSGGLLLAVAAIELTRAALDYVDEKVERAIARLHADQDFPLTDKQQDLLLLPPQSLGATVLEHFAELGPN